MKSQSMIRALLSLIATSVLLTTTPAAFSMSPADTAPDPSAVPADNSKSNKVDPSNTSMTADAQKNDINDRTITQRVRKSLIADKSLSTYAHNVKVVTVNGRVTLNGVVRTDEERAAVEAKAVSVVGQGSVENDLKVAPKS
jgi:osmotically-inducible protein OsmY